MDERVELAQRKGRRCMYCSGQRPVETITERLFLCCQKCADWDNNARVVKTTLPCICCGVELSPTWKEETITVNSVSQTIRRWMAGSISCGYGSTLDTNVYMIAVCDSCIKERVASGKLTFVYSYMPRGDGSEITC